MLELAIIVSSVAVIIMWSTYLELKEMDKTRDELIAPLDELLLKVKERR